MDDNGRQLAGEALAALEHEARRLGFDGWRAPAWEEAERERRRDPADGSTALVACWRNGRGERVGELVINADGTLFAECDVVAIYPGRSRWFVEAVTAWGRAGAIHAEPRLLPLPE